MDVSALIGTRLRMQRLKDARLFSGWVDTAVGGMVHVSLGSDEPIEEGDNFFCEGLTFTHRLSFKAFVERSLGNGKGARYMLRLTAPPVMTTSQEHPRYRVPPLAVTLTAGEEVCQGFLEDVCIAGLGVMSPIRFDKGMLVNVDIPEPVGPMRLTAQVRYFRNLGENEDVQLGLQIFGMERESAQKWVQFVHWVAVGNRPRASA